MNLAKIIRVYFLFVMTTVSVAALAYNDTVESYAVELLYSSSLSSAENIHLWENGDTYLDKDNKSFVSNKENNGNLIFEIKNDPQKAFAIPGAKNVEIMELNFRTDNKKSFFTQLILKNVDVSGKNILAAYLKDGEDIISEAVIANEYLKFRNFDFIIEPNTQKSLKLFMDLSQNLKPGQRFRFDIEEPEDITISIGEKPYIINKYYPIKGKYLSITKEISAELPEGHEDDLLKLSE